ncbi:MAG: hypothetical protein ACE5EE_06880 [Fidelibacterota bacterium]
MSFRKKILTFNLIMVFSLTADESDIPTLNAIIQNVNNQFQKVEDYSTTMILNIELPLVRMPSKKLQFYFKQPNKVKIEAEGFAIVPKTGLGGSAIELLSELDSAKVLGKEERGARVYWVVEGKLTTDSLLAVPWQGEQQNTDIEIKITMWIDCERWVIGHTETLLDSLKAVVISTTYGEYEEQIYLPMVTEIQLDTSIFRNMSHGRTSEGPFGDHYDVTSSNKPGIIRMEFQQYKINQGLQDELFQE